MRMYVKAEPRKKQITIMKKEKKLLMIVGMVVMSLLGGCIEEENSISEITNIVDIQQGSKAVFFTLENGCSVKVKKNCLYFSSVNTYWKVKNEEEAFLWQMAEIGDTVRLVEVEKRWIYKAPEKTVKIAAVTDGIMLENGCSVKLEAKKTNGVYFYKNGYEIYSYRDKEAVFLWKYAQVGQEVSISKKPIPINCLPKIEAIDAVDGWRVYRLSNGQEMWLDLDYQVREVSKRVVLKSRKGQILNKSYDEAVYYRWLQAQVGQELEPWGEENYFHKIIWYTLIPVDLPDYQIERVVKTVSKYDGSMAKIEGNLHGSQVLFYGSGGGKIKGESMSSKDFLINIFFEEDVPPISVNVKENQLWLEIEAGCIVIEKRVNGIVSYEPKF